MKVLSFALVVGCVLASGAIAQAASTSTPYLFTTQPMASTGHFEWDEFMNVAPDGPLGPHVPDVISSGIGTAELSVTDPTPAFGPLITSTQNIYSGSDLIDFTIDLSGLSDADSNTTVVLQIGVAGALEDFSLSGAPPTTLIDRGTADVTSVRPDTTTSALDTRHYWVAWDAAAATDYAITFGNPTGNTSFSHARVEYYNSATPFQPVPAGNVPEPTSIALASLSSCALLLARRRQQRG